MGSARIKIDVKGLREMRQALRDVRTEGLRQVQGDLDAALERTAATSRGLAHVSHDHRHAGDLKASQEVSSEHDPNGWTGTIIYSDRAAQFEVQRGGDHSLFLDALTALFDGDFERALLSGFFRL